MEDNDALQRADALFMAEMANEALALLEQQLKVSPKNTWISWKIGRFAGCMGDEARYSEIMRSIPLNFPGLQGFDLCAAKRDAVRVMDVMDLSLIYIPTPKCGSTSIKNRIAHKFGEAAENSSIHFTANSKMKNVSWAELTQLSNTRKLFGIYRPFQARLRSYYQTNIRKHGSLVLESGNRDAFYGLNCRPTYLETLNNFDRYRQIFRDFRAHTDNLTAYFPEQLEMIKVFNLKDMNAAIDYAGLEKAKLSSSQELRGDSGAFTPSDQEIVLERQLAERLYQSELTI